MNDGKLIVLSILIAFYIVLTICIEAFKHDEYEDRFVLPWEIYKNRKVNIIGAIGLFLMRLIFRPWTTIYRLLIWIVTVGRK